MLCERKNEQKNPMGALIDCIFPQSFESRDDDFPQPERCSRGSKSNTNARVRRIPMSTSANGHNDILSDLRGRVENIFDTRIADSNGLDIADTVERIALDLENELSDAAAVMY